MSKAEIRKVKAIIRRLKEAAYMSDEIELTLGNGGLCGSIIGSMAAELECAVDREERTAKQP